MSDSLRIALAQIDPVVGDVPGNVQRILAARRAAGNADLVVCPELAVSGYPPEDLVLKSAFLSAVKSGIRDLAAATADGGPALLVGAPWRVVEKRYNALLLLEEGAVGAVRLKHHLPNYGVFDEARVFSAGPMPSPINFRGIKIGCPICEDMWFSDVSASLQAAGADILIVANGSPYEVDKAGVRLAHATARAVETGLPLIYLNQVGGQDELVFDGASFVVDADGEEVCRLPAWREETIVTEWRRKKKGWVCRPAPLAPSESASESVYQAMVLGLRDYVRKNGFQGVLIGLSGGIDSAISAAVAVDALGADKVRCVMMPSPFTSVDSLEDADKVASLLGIQLDTIGIQPAMEAFSAMLAAPFAGTEAGVAEENIQARARGMTLMALSNKLGAMVLSTGNKSEMSVGYSTLYGDMCGGFSVLKDVYKTTVFTLARWRNTHKPEGCLGPTGPVMPDRVLTKAPTAELRPNQTDQDSLPPYAELDAILACLIEREMGAADTIAAGHDAATVRRVFRMLDRAEYKRRQAPPGVKISSRAFGRDRRYPIVNGFTDAVS
jgi:NAD+ synthase